jgi:hypothetical protein
MLRKLDESAATEVIGDVLSVAIIIVLAAISLTFLIILAQSAGTPSTTGISVDIVQITKEDRAFQLTYHGAQRHDELEWLNWTIADGAGLSHQGSRQKPYVGYSWLSPTIPSSAWNPPYRFYAVATFTDRTQQLVYDNTFE